VLHIPTLNFRIQKYLEVDMGSRFEGEEVAVCGYPMASTTVHPENNSITINLSLKVAAGIISSQKLDNGSKILELDFPIIPGNSGGPVFSIHTGKVLGLAAATLSVMNQNGMTIGHVGVAKDIRNTKSAISQFL